jgi:hypothetical protein
VTISALDTLLSVLHDRGVVNETGLDTVCADLFAGQPLSLDHLIMIFGVAPVFRLLTIPDDTARQLVRDASRLLNEDLDKLSWGSDVKDWNRAAQALLGIEDP